MLKKVMILLCVTTRLHAQAPTSVVVSDSVQKAWQEAFIIQAKVMEKKHNLSLGVDWKPIVKFGEIPIEPLIPEFTWAQAMYQPIHQTFLISQLGSMTIDTSLINHELAHAFIDQLSRHNGNGSWPNAEILATSDRDGERAIRIIEEGLATYLGGYAEYELPLNYGENWLPEGKYDVRWGLVNHRYLGGYWLVAPIVREFHEKGILYVTTHPLRFKNGKVRSAAKKYQKEALKYLKKHSGKIILSEQKTS